MHAPACFSSRVFQLITRGQIGAPIWTFSSHLQPWSRPSHSAGSHAYIEVQMNMLIRLHESQRGIVHRQCQLDHTGGLELR
jgi:hypothetical protein